MYKLILSLFTAFLFIAIFEKCNSKPKNESVKIVITKLRTRDDLAKKLSSIMEDNYETYSSFLNNNDSLKKYNKDTNTLMCAIIPNTYEVYKGSSLTKVMKKITDYENTFWNETRKQKASKLGFTPNEIYTIASIVEEETTRPEDKGKIASVYINRMNKKMPLQADPTIKFALDSFQLTRIYEKYIKMTANSPYNTYTHPGLPPGPICTPSIKTIDAVLDVPSTDYIYFVAQPNFSGLSNFTNDYKVHLKNGDLYHKFLDSIAIAKKNK